MADSDGRDETGSSSGKTRVKDSQLEDHNQQRAAINTPSASSEEGEEAREHQEAEPTVQETNRESREEGDGNRDASTGEEKEEINEEAENPLLHGEMSKKMETDHKDGSGVVPLTLVGADLPGAQTGETAMTMMGRWGSEVGGGVSEYAPAERRLVPLRRPAYKYTYRYRVRTFTKGQAVGVHGIQHGYAKNAAAASLDHNAAAASHRAEEPPPRPAGEDKGARDEDEEEDDKDLKLQEK